MGAIGVSVVGLLVILSIFIQNFWCRFLCPYGALMGIVSSLSPTKIRRDMDACIDCAKCSKACPSKLPVDKLVQIRSVECTACMECVATCPAQNALQFSLPAQSGQAGSSPETISARWTRRVLQPHMIAAVLAFLFFGLIGLAQITGHWRTHVSRDIYMQLVPHADEFSH
jgi:polyferredoxin